jgi:FKBP12-rapamycin complex-associated protein
VFEKVLETLKVATELDPMGYNAWHAWALANYQAAGHHGSNATPHDPPASLRRGTSASGNGGLSAGLGLSAAADDQADIYQAAAVRGFFRSVSLGQDRPRSTILQDILRLITLWFNHGEMPDVYEAMRQGMQEVSIDTWLDVLIQLIARLPTGEPRTDQLLHEILSKVGQAHPQVLLIDCATNRLY